MSSSDSGPSSSHMGWESFPILEAVLGFSWLVYIWESYLSSRQRRIYRTCKEVPQELTSVIDQKTFENSRKYALDKNMYGFWNGLYSQVEVTMILWFGGIPFLWKISGGLLEKMGYNESYEILQSLLFSFLGNMYSLFTDLPWTLYFTFVIEERHGFNKMTFGFFIKDLVKKTIISQIITMLVLSVIIYIVKIGGPYFYIYAWAAVFVISMVFLHVYPEYIAPLFDKYTPLEDGVLKQKIEELAQSVNFPLTKIFVVDGSKRSSHSNAYMYGFHKNKRIVLFDTLLEDYSLPTSGTEEEQSEEETQNVPSEEASSAPDDAAAEPTADKDKKKKGCNNDEAVAILGHELGHWSYSHMLKNLAIMQASIFFSFLVFGILMKIRPIFNAFGFPRQQPILIRLFVVFSFIFSPINEVESFLMNMLSRRFEFQADDFAVQLGKGDLLQSGLLKIFKDNLAFPVADWVYSMRHYSHPPLLERLRAIEEYKKKLT